MNIEYFAGLFDGEGCVMISKHHYGRLNRPSYILVMKITMIHRGVIEEIKKSFGGGITTYRWHTRSNNRPAHRWTLHSDKSAALLQQALPYLIVKKEEAQVAIAFQAHLSEYRNRAKHLPQEQQVALYEYRENTYRQLQVMKKMVGVSDGMDANSGEGENRQPRAKLSAV